MCAEERAGLTAKYLYEPTLFRPCNKLSYHCSPISQFGRYLYEQFEEYSRLLYLLRYCAISEQLSEFRNRPWIFCRETKCFLFSPWITHVLDWAW